MQINGGRLIQSCYHCPVTDNLLFYYNYYYFFVTGDFVDYTLQFTTHYDSYDPFVGTDPCGTEGATKGLRFYFSDTDLVGIPPGEYVEVPFYINDPGNYCREYNNLELQIIATCEMRTSSESATFQYGYLNPGAVGQALQISYKASDAFHATNSTAYFSVAWPAWPTSSPVQTRSLSSDASAQASTISNGVSATHVVIPNWMVMFLFIIIMMAMLCGYLLRVAESQIQMKPVPAPDNREKRNTYFPERVQVWFRSS